MKLKLGSLLDDGDEDCGEDEEGDHSGIGDRENEDPNILESDLEKEYDEQQDLLNIVGETSQDSPIVRLRELCKKLKWSEKLRLD